MKKILDSLQTHIATIILFKIRISDGTILKTFERCDPKNRRRKHRLDMKGSIKGNWEPHKSQHLHILFLSNTYSSKTGNTQASWIKYFLKILKFGILILLKIYITQKNKMAEFKMAAIIRLSENEWVLVRLN